MAITKKTLFADNLDKYNTFITDTDPLSKYFKLTELPDTFTGGKNAFLIQGSEYLVADSLIKIELKDAKGDIIYHEPGEGIISASVGGEPIITEYYEGVSKLVSVYIYPDTSFGPCTLTILGELSSYDNNGTDIPIPANWEGSYNVKWQKQINVVPSLANTTKIRFYKRPTAKITEILSPIYKIENDLKVASSVTQSFADIKLSNLETFAGDVKRVKVFRTSIGDISDYDLIQDILVESKELLTSYGLSGSVVGNTGIFTAEVLKNQWNSGSLNATLNSTRVEAGVRLTGSGNFRYTQSLDLKSTNTYELNLDAFYSASTDSNLGIYLISGSTSSSIGTLIGTQPTKNLLDTTIPFKVDRDYPTASLYFSQSQGQWHVGNVSLKLSEDTAFSPDEISFITTMPTVLGNETFNFKFEFYDVNNNYVPVEVTQSALFNGGNTNIGGTILLISSSASSSLADLNRVSSSISGTVTFNSSSISGTIGAVSSSVSGTIGTVSGSVFTLSGSVSGTIGAVSSSVSGTIGVLSGSVSGTIGTLSSSVSASISNAKADAFARVQQLANGGYSGTFIDNNLIYSPVIGGQLGYFSTLFKVGTTPSIYLDARQNPRKIFIGGVVNPSDTVYNEYSGAFNNTNTSVYLDSTGKFSLGNKLSWNGVDTLSITGNLNVGSSVPNSAVTGLGALATKSSVSATEIDENAITEAKILNGAVSTGKIVNDAINEAKLALGAVTSGKISAGAVIAEKIGANAVIAEKIFAGAVTAEKILAGAVTAEKILAGAVTAEKILAGTITADRIAVGAITADRIAAGTITADKIDVSGVVSAGNIVVGGQGVDRLTNNAGYQANGSDKTAGSVGGWTIDSNSIRGNNPTGGGDGAYTTNTGIILSSAGWISSKNFYINSSGNAAFRGNITATGGSFTGDVTAGGVTIGTSGITITGTYGINVNAALGIYVQGDRALSGYTNYREFENGREANTGANIGEQINTVFTWYTRNQNFGEGAICGIAASTGNLSFYGNGGVRAYRFTQDGGGYTNGSDRRLKDNINKLDDKFGIEFINKLNPVEFVYKKTPQYKKFGFIAQEVSSSLLEYDMNMDNSTIVQCDETTKDKTLVMDYTEFITPLIKAVQQLSAKVEQLEARLSGSV
jgi:hypothetical protein